MLSDLDALMRDRGIDAVIVPMHEAMHPSFRWLARGAKVTKGYAIKPLDREPLLLTYPMEREEAAASGLEVWLTTDLEREKIFQDAAHPTAGYAALFTEALRRLGTGPAVAFFGNAPIQLYMGIAEEMTSRGWRVVLPHGEDLIQLARKRKDPREVEAIRSVGRRTVNVVAKVRQVLREATVSGDGLLHDGRPLTLGTLKQLVSLEIARLGMVEDHETILSQGRDAAIPHSRGDASAPVRPSLPIVLDIFPVDAASGYFFDYTRTLCPGPIPDELRTMHAQVYEAFCAARDAIRPGALAQSYQALVCDYFEKHGHETLRSNPKTTAGYVHGLGHGVGLEVHEKPGFHLGAANRDLVETGDILTIEPGLYYPGREMGVRIEDTFVVTESGVESLSPGDYGLEP